MHSHLSLYPGTDQLSYSRSLQGGDSRGARQVGAHSGVQRL